MRSEPTAFPSDHHDAGPARPLAPREAVPTSIPPLPQTLTSFIGREREVDAVQTLLARDDVRLVTLTGPGGVGKTRLALRVAETSRGAFPDGAWFVDLAPLYDPGAVAPAIARALGIRPDGDQPVERRIVEVLRDRRALLVLDNFEQILEAASLVTDLLVACPRLTVLVTSRVALRLSGEQRFVVPPLPVADASAAASLDALLEIDAVRLFADRARSTSSDFTLTDENVAGVAEICARLDGMPLAIELAAARSSVLSPANMLKRLDERLHVLGEGPRDAPARLRSMRDSIAWSHDLLAPGEQALFRQLGVLVGTWTLDAAEAVAGADDQTTRKRVFEALAALVDASLVRRQAIDSGETAYRMLVPIRELAEELLEHSPEGELVRRRHADLIIQIASRLEVATYLPDGAHISDRMRIHAANIPTALGWLERQGDVNGLLELTGSLAYFWSGQGQVREGRAWLERAVALGRGSGAPHLGFALIGLGGLTHMEGDEDAGLALCREGRNLVEGRNDVQAKMAGYVTEGIIALRMGAMDHAVAMQEVALALARSAPDLDWTATAESSVLGHLGNIAVGCGDIDAADRYFQEALQVQRDLGFEPGTSHFMANHSLAGLGDVARARGDLPGALAHYRNGLKFAHRFHDYRASIYALGGVAGTLAASGNWRAAARLFGADEALHERGGFNFELETTDRQRALGLPEPWMRQGEPFGSGQPLHDELWSERKPSLPPIPDHAAAAALWAAGHALTIEEAVAEALAAKPGAPTDTDGKHLPFGLTQREVEVLRELVTGKSDAEIAAALYISRRTVATHVQHVYNKLDISSRAEAAALAVRQGLA